MKNFRNSEYTLKTQVLDFFQKYPNAGAGKLDREKAIEVLDTNIKWIDNYRFVIEWVTSQCPNDTCLWNIYSDQFFRRAPNFTVEFGKNVFLR